MRKLVVCASIALGPVLGTMSYSLPSEARPVNSGLGYNLAQVSEPSSSDVLTPTLKSVGKRPDYMGLVSAYDGQAIDVRLADGTTKTFLFPENIGGDAPNLSIGQAIAFDAKDDTITGFDIPVVEREFIGQASEIVPGTSDAPGQVTVVSGTGETMDAPVSESTIANLGLKNGDELKVTMFQGMPDTFSVCKIQRAAVAPPPAPAPVVPAPIPQPAPPVIEALPALW